MCRLSEADGSIAELFLSMHQKIKERIIPKCMLKQCVFLFLLDIRFFGDLWRNRLWQSEWKNLCSKRLEKCQIRGKTNGQLSRCN